jgi:uncharacterized protein YodC (DUF2158 family)
MAILTGIFAVGDEVRWKNGSTVWRVVGHAVDGMVPLVDENGYNGMIDEDISQWRLDSETCEIVRNKSTQFTDLYTKLSS